MDIAGYLTEIRKLYASGQSTEHSFRPALYRLFQSVDAGLTVVNEPKHLTDVGAPDFVFNRGEVAIGWCEAKDIGKDVRKFAAHDYGRAQKERYKKGLPNLIYTNGLDFEFIREGDVVDFISIADVTTGLPAHPNNFSALANRLRDFATTTPLSITSSTKLAAMMAGKAAIIKDIMGRALVADMKAKDATGATTDLIGQFDAFKASLIHDITIEEFADIYAETIAYGLFAARLHDETPNTFTRGEALDLLPKTNPFLRELFIYIAGPNLDGRLCRIIDELCNLFCAANMDKVLRNFGKITKRNDPFLHFYEDFLAEYNPGKRKARGVWYTPEPVVNFIVRAVDEVLRTEFDLSDGLADTSKITINWDTGQNHPKTGKPDYIKKEVHRVQILDPATGTGTFLAEVVKLVSERINDVAPGQLSPYIERDLIPRLHGFELLMASYAMCHMKLDMILTRLGYKPSAIPPRIGVYLTNSLEEGERVEQTLFGLSRAIANEAKAASDIKRQTPIMCVIGNPPYSAATQNKSEWASNLVADYKTGLTEKKINLDDDYIKFIALSQKLINKSGHGVIAMITNNSFLDGVTHRQMRRKLMEDFQSITVLNLNGDSKSGAADFDENVFDIMQGVSITILVKKQGGVPCKSINYRDIMGARKDKYEFLFSNGRSDSGFYNVEPQEPYLFFVPKDFSRTEWDDFVRIDDLFIERGIGAKTERDRVSIHFDRKGIERAVDDFSVGNIDEIKMKYELKSDSRDWAVSKAISDIRKYHGQELFREIQYKPFDKRWTYYTGTSRGFMGTPGRSISMNMLSDNFAIIVNKKFVSGSFSHVSVADTLFGHGVHYLGNRGQDYGFPLYLYPEEGTLDQALRVNFNPRLYAQIRDAAGLHGSLTLSAGTDAFRRSTGEGRPDEVKVFDYIYGVLHCRAYREAYGEFLKIDFPRIPLPFSPASFRAVSEQGEALRRLHLMEDGVIGATPYPFHGDGECVVERPRYENGRVWINGRGDTGQYFKNVPALAWDFLIGGYQPAQKWLKDRRGRILSYDDVRHYQRIIAILVETDRIMGEIDMPSIDATVLQA